MLRHQLSIALIPCLLLLLITPAMACLWDSDTLQAELHAKPTIFNTIVGRFERNPPLYYEMRLARVSEELQSDPTLLSHYDDAAVACDRLGRHEEAIEWMSRKKVQLDKLDADSQEFATQQYRYLANLGTFYAHRWFARGADREDMQDLMIGRDLIAKAIELNPDAHFGREVYQLMTMNWVIETSAIAPEDDEDVYARSIIGGKTNRSYRRTSAEEGDEIDSNDAAEGFAGLVSLGNAWQSVDIFHALSDALKLAGDASLSKFARLRMDELTWDGHKSLRETATGIRPSFRFEYGYQLADSRHKIQEELYQKARANADQWHEHRTAFMLSQLQAGKHPDTHEDFWEGYEEIPPVGIKESIFAGNETLHRLSRPPFVYLVYLVFLVSGYYLIRRSITVFTAVAASRKRRPAGRL